MPTTCQGPLAGVRAIELGQIAAGPFAGSLLADLGADVIKIERPDGGDGMRSWPPISTAADGEAPYSENFASLNRNKRSVVLDLKDRTGVERLLQLAGVADLLVENYRPGVLERLGAGYEAVSARNPRIVYCSISGYGQTGPYAGKGAFDVTVQGMSGLMSVTGEPGGGPVKCGVPVGDFCAGLYAAYTITANLMRARETGRGARIDCSMLGSLIAVAALQTSEYFGTGKAPRLFGSAHPRNAPYQAFRASDAHFIIAAGNDRLFAQVCAAVGCGRKWPRTRVSPPSNFVRSTRTRSPQSSARSSPSAPRPSGSRRWTPAACLARPSTTTRGSSTTTRKSRTSGSSIR